MLGVLVCLTSGAAMVFPGQAFDAGTVLRTVDEERCTSLHGVPTMFLAILDHADFGRTDLSSLRTGIAAGASCPPTMNIYPAEVEAFLLRHPSIADAAVFGLPDEQYGERVCAWIKCREPIEPETIIAWCRGRMAHHKIPVLVRIVETFPLTVIGKVQKFAMRGAEGEA